MKPKPQTPVLTEDEQQQLIAQSRRFAVLEQPPEVKEFWADVQAYLDRGERKGTT